MYVCISRSARFGYDPIFAGSPEADEPPTHPRKDPDSGNPMHFSIGLAIFMIPYRMHVVVAGVVVAKAFFYDLLLKCVASIGDRFGSVWGQLGADFGSVWLPRLAHPPNALQRKLMFAQFSIRGVSYPVISRLVKIFS